MAHISSHLQDCIDNCTNCHAICLETIHHCLAKGGEHAEAHHIRLLTDCAEICQISANYMLRGSEFHNETCRACAVICEECAKSCEEMEDDSEMRKCAQICRECAESCRKMSMRRAA